MIGVFQAPVRGGPVPAAGALDPGLAAGEAAGGRRRRQEQGRQLQLRRHRHRQRQQQRQLGPAQRQLGAHTIARAGVVAVTAAGYTARHQSASPWRPEC